MILGDVNITHAHRLSIHGYAYQGLIASVSPEANFIVTPASDVLSRQQIKKGTTH